MRGADSQPSVADSSVSRSSLSFKHRSLSGSLYFSYAYNVNISAASTDVIVAKHARVYCFLIFSKLIKQPKFTKSRNLIIKTEETASKTLKKIPQKTFL